MQRHRVPLARLLKPCRLDVKSASFLRNNASRGVIFFVQDRDEDELEGFVSAADLAVPFELRPEIVGRREVDNIVELALSRIFPPVVLNASQKKQSKPPPRPISGGGRGGSGRSQETTGPDTSLMSKKFKTLLLTEQDKPRTTMTPPPRSLIVESSKPSQAETEENTATGLDLKNATKINLWCCWCIIVNK